MRAFIVGNGPSLKPRHLDNLIGEQTFATNRIRLMYDKTDWRPSFYVRAEGMELIGEPPIELWLEDIMIHLDNPNVQTWCNHYYYHMMGKNGVGLGEIARSPKTTWMDACTHYLTHYDKDNCPVTWHFPRLCSFGSSVNVAIQIAVQKGFYPIYLIGCDLGYKDNLPTHFSPDYEVGYERLLRPAIYANNDTYLAHIIAKRSSPVEIFNATDGGMLEVYPRVNFEELF